VLLATSLAKAATQLDIFLLTAGIEKL